MDFLIRCKPFTIWGAEEEKKKSVEQTFTGNRIKGTESEQHHFSRLLMLQS
jgi:hypothetical protein